MLSQVQHIKKHLTFVDLLKSWLESKNNLQDLSEAVSIAQNFMDEHYPRRSGLTDEVKIAMINAFPSSLLATKIKTDYVAAGSNLWSSTAADDADQAIKLVFPKIFQRIAHTEF